MPIMYFNTNIKHNALSKADFKRTTNGFGIYLTNKPNHKYRYSYPIEVNRHIPELWCDELTINQQQLEQLLNVLPQKYPLNASDILAHVDCDASLLWLLVDMSLDKFITLKIFRQYVYGDYVKLKDGCLFLDLADLTFSKRIKEKAKA